jgi:hypothetical protein
MIKFNKGVVIRTNIVKVPDKIKKIIVTENVRGHVQDVETSYENH